MKVDMEDNSKPKSTAKLLANICLIGTFLAMATAIIVDFVTLSEVIIQFVFSLIVPVIAFFVLFVAMVASWMLIFGVALTEQYGFWPLDISWDIYKQIIGEIKIDPDKLAIFRGVRIGLLVVCIVLYITAIVARIMNRKYKKEGEIKLYRSTKRRAKTAMFFLFFGIVVAAGALVLTAKLL